MPQANQTKREQGLRVTKAEHRKQESEQVEEEIRSRASRGRVQQNKAIRGL